MGCTLSTSARVATTPHAAKTGSNPSKTNGSVHPQIKDGTLGKDKLRGDVTKRYEAKKEREDKLRSKQRKVAIAAEELSNIAMDEKEMLSLTSRSRGTSRATSRTASPSTSRKPASFKPSVPDIETVSGKSVPAQNGVIEVAS